MHSEESRAIVNGFLQKMVSLPIWYVSCGGSVGSTFSFAIGKKILRKGQLKNPGHSTHFQKFEGELNLYVWSSWRLSQRGIVISTSQDEQSGLVERLENLIDHVVDEVIVSPPFWDLVLSISDDYRLEVFCDTMPAQFDGSWDLFTETQELCVGPGNLVQLDGNEILPG